MAGDFTDYKFDWVEYSVVAAMLLLSLLVGVYYTFFKKQKTFVDYMLGGKTMGIFPVTMSLVASNISGVTILGIPTEIYLYGTQYAAANFTVPVFILITAVFYLPIYYKLQLNSVFEYLELRFNKHVRIIGVVLFAINVMMYLPSVIYVPAVIFNQVTDIPLHVISVIISGICIFYTTFGGLKAVAWTDAIQNVFTFFAMVLVIAVGTSRLGGFREVWRINEQGGRIELFNMDPNPFARYTFWTSCVGYMSNYWITYAIIPSSVQRYMAVPTVRHAKWVLFYACMGFYMVINMTTYLGMILYARYYQCDPVASGVIKNFSQMVTLYVMEVGKEFPGLAGLFIAGIFSASLSTMSSWLNSIGGMLYKDVMAVYFPTVCHSEATQSKIIKTTVIVMGTVSVLMVFAVEKMGTIYQVSVSALGVVYGALFSLFTLGMFFPRGNAKGAVTGAVASFLLASWIIFHAQFYIIEGKLKFPGKKTSIDECPVEIYQNYDSNPSLLYNYTGLGSTVVADISVAQVYQLSYHYYTTISAVSGLVVGVVVSLLTEPPDISSLSPDLFTPCVQRFLPHKKQEIRPNTMNYELSSQNDIDGAVEK